MNVFSEHVQSASEPPEPPARSRAERREAPRLKVLASADRLFREQGFAAATVRQIAADAGVSAGSVMAVGDKDALLIAIFDGWIGAEQGARSTGAAGPLSPADAVREITGLVEPFVGYFALDRDLSREYAAVLVRGRHESEVFQGLAVGLIGEFAAALARCTALTEAEAGPGAMVVYYAYLGILMAASSGAVEVERILDQFRDAVRFVVRYEGA